ncbi:MAG: hypothetical protein M1819_002616 [Sarea resinae]|nr:MAG: hypothetical protein M1819_002616 [Sarea resinae]
MLIDATAEGRARKRFQHSNADNDARTRRSTAFAPSAKGIAEARPSFASRRKSLRDQKAPLGPRQPDFAPSKRDNLKSTTKPSTQSFLPSSTSEPALFGQLPARGAAPSTSADASEGYRENIENTSGSFDFLPQVSFDELQSSLISDDQTLSQFPAPGGGGGILANKSLGSDMGRNYEKDEQSGTEGSGTSMRTTRIGRNDSLLRRQSAASAQRQASLTMAQAAPESMGPPNAPLPVRTRRQSHFPTPTTMAAAARQPRKSVGPGILVPESDDKTPQWRRPSLTSSNSTNTLSSQTESRRPSVGRMSIGGRAIVGGAEASQLSVAPRNVKAKSLQPPPKEAEGHLAATATPDQGRRSSVARSPLRSPDPRTITPSSSSKRHSVMPSHATGLGARTISPTDARRMKRLSTMPTAPPMPATPPTPQPEALPAARSTVESPSYIPRKSVTPSSSRTTPEHNRKSYSSGISVSSNTSFASARTSTSSLQPRLSTNLTASRLPAPKPRNVHSSAGSAAGEEEVPPVPAIPKAYESPKEQHETAPLPRRKSSLPLEATIGSAMPMPDGPVAEKDEPLNVDPRERRVAAIGVGSEGERKTSNPSNLSKKNLQPLRLPPINLLPLSTPTAARIAALPGSSSEVQEGRVTPPPTRAPPKTPSTPMTASKATTFFRSNGDDDDLPSAVPFRSNTHQALRTESPSISAASSSSNSNIPLESNNPYGHMSPYMSTSLPKGSGDATYMKPKQSGDYNTINFGSELRSSKLMGPRSQVPTKAASEETPTQASSPTEPDTPSSGSSLRRKLSLSWKRSSSKASHAAAERDAEYPPQPPKHNNMPPPKYPASATSGAAGFSPSPSLKSTSHLDSRRRKSSASSATLVNGHDRTKSDSWGTLLGNHSQKKETIPPPELSSQAHTTGRTGSSILSPMHRILGSKSSMNLRAKVTVDSHLDRDDLVAEEEMKKLASKRKDFEVAARELDELRRKASPKDRVSAAQALRTANLNIFERGEIIDYKEVYFTGTSKAKKHVGDLNTQSANFGYDDERGDYNIVEGDHLAYRYEILNVLGKGSFGQVVRCVDHKNGTLVAIKIIRNKKRFHQQALVEVNILQKLREWDPNNEHSMVSFTQSFYFRGHLCISTELLGMNLYEFIKCHDFRGFSLKLIRRFTKQLLSSLVLLKRHRVIHCDLKPENILLAHPVHSEIKVIDFGSSCFENEKVYTYIQSRFYRSPEVILGMTYGMPIDMWSLGCILAELFTGYPIFPGENEQEQLACIMEVFGPPEKHLIEKSTRKKLFFDSLGKPRLNVSSKGRRRRPSSKSLQQALKCDDDAFLDFIGRCLRWDPDRRLKPDEAIHHEFITGIKKSSVRSRPQGATSTDSPMKRFNTTHTPSGVRPLPEPPATSFKNGTAVRTNIPSSSPNKPAAPKRHSTVNGLQPTIGVKRSSTGTALASNLPRVATRSVSGKPDLASAAAATSLV